MAKLLVVVLTGGFLVVVTALAALQGAESLAAAMGVTLGVVALTFLAEWLAERRRTASR